VRHPFRPDDLADDPGYLELRDRVLRAHGVHAPPPGPTVWIEGPAQLLLAQVPSAEASTSDRAGLAT
jgi:hypothetical protein